MEEAWIVDRARLRQHLQLYPNWQNKEYANAIGRSIGWVKKWKKRLCDAPLEDEAVLQSLSRERKHPPDKIHMTVVQKILQIRDEPPDNLRRVPGPKAIIYYLKKDKDLAASTHHIPSSTATIWRILDENQRILRPPTVDHEPLERLEPMVEWQIDFKDVKMARSDAEEYRAHDIQTFDVVDAGTSILVANPARTDYNATTVIETLVTIFAQHGLPQQLRFDRDTRFIGSWRGRDFPTPFVRFLHALDIRPIVNPPQRPDKNCFVERYHRTYEYECLRHDRPRTLQAVNEVNASFLAHYNFERPNQALSCHNLPPKVAFPILPVLPRLPESINPDRWVSQLAGKYYQRLVTKKGSVQLGGQRYYVGKIHGGKTILATVDRHFQLINFIWDKTVIRSVPIKGLYESQIKLSAYVPLICREAESDYRRALANKKRLRRVTM